MLFIACVFFEESNTAYHYLSSHWVYKRKEKKNNNKYWIYDKIIIAEIVSGIGCAWVYTPFNSVNNTTMFWTESPENTHMNSFKNCVCQFSKTKYAVRDYVLRSTDIRDDL